MSDQRETKPIRREIPKRNEMGSYNMHSSSPIRESASRFRDQLKSLIPAAIIGWTRIGFSPEETEVTEDAADESREEIFTVAGSKEPGIILGRNLIDLYPGEGEGSSGSPDSEGSDLGSA